MNPWLMQRLVALHCEELRRVADRARANPRRQQRRLPLALGRHRPYPVPDFLGGEVLERLAALVVLEDA
jgi:hypothetical protein